MGEKEKVNYCMADYNDFIKVSCEILLEGKYLIVGMLENTTVYSTVGLVCLN